MNNTNNTYNPAIVIVTYNRVSSLKRLLDSLNNSNYNLRKNIPCVICIDGGYTEDVFSIAQSFNWLHGEKIIIKQDTRLGLRKHIIKCGDLSIEYGSIILFEDDMFVSPNFYDFTCKALGYYHNNPNIAGISTYSYNKNKFIKLPFIPINNGYDCYFMQLPSSWGQVWTKEQWLLFKNYYNEGHEITATDKIPDQIKSWPETSWLKYYAKYMVEKNLYFVFPYTAFSTNFAESGEHYKTVDLYEQVPLTTNAVLHNYRFPPFDNRAVKYDIYFDISADFLVYNKFIDSDSILVDLCGSKQLNLFTEYQKILTIREIKNSEKSFGFSLLPVENNIIHNILGGFIHIGNYKECENNVPLKKLRRLAEHGFSNTYYHGYEQRWEIDRKMIEYKIGFLFLHPIKIIKYLFKHISKKNI